MNIAKLVALKVKEAEECFAHTMNCAFWGNVSSRKYRRGKNRCKRCGYRIEDN